MIEYNIKEEDEFGDRVTIELLIDGEQAGMSTIEFKFDLDGDIPEEHQHLFKEEKYAELETLYVNGSHRGQGFAGSLITETLDYIRTRGYSIAYLNACPTDYYGLSLYNLTNFYKGYGFESFIIEDNNEEMLLNL